MNKTPSSPLTCPVCSKMLTQTDRTLRCENNHSFDLAKEGHVNLLLSHHRKSRNPGDDRAMIQARRRFFDSGAFDPLAKQIVRAASDLQHPAVLDCGCGEGHLLGSLSEQLAGRFFGVDISKEAVRCAARRYKGASWIVANGMRRLPLAGQSMDLILSVLAPRNAGEFARVLKPDGRLLLGVPGPDHLIELRAQLAGTAADFGEKADEAAAKCASLFAETDRQLLSYRVQLDRQQLADLIQMTPIFWTSAPEAKEKVQEAESLDVTVSFALLTLQPAGLNPSH